MVPSGTNIGGMGGKIRITEEVIKISQKHILLIGKLFKKTKPGKNFFPASSLPKNQIRIKLFVFFQNILYIIRCNSAIGLIAYKDNRSEATCTYTSQAGQRKLVIFC